MSSRFQLTYEVSNAISIIRMAACFSIVVCHILQAYGNAWAYIFNVGVQVFFLLSGFLYGVFGVKDISKFYTKRFKKIYLPYFLWTCIIGVILLMVNRDIITLKSMIRQMCMLGTLPGQSLLWFMSVLLICYLIVPLFELIKSQKTSLFVLSIWLLFMTSCFLYTENARYLWFTVYFIGYGIGRYKNIVYPFGLSASMSFAYTTFITRLLSAYKPVESD